MGNVIGQAVLKEADIASAGTCDIGATNEWRLNITGATTITSFGTVANRMRFLRFAGALTLTYNVTSLILPGLANIATAAGDTAIAVSDGSGNWRLLEYVRAARTVNELVGGPGMVVSSGGIYIKGSHPRGRLTLTSLTPVLLSDVTAATSVYFTPFEGNTIPLYDGSKFLTFEFSELTLALSNNSGHTGYHQSGKNFDLYVYYDAGIIRLGTGPAWSSDTARGTGAGTTEIELVDGFWVNKNTMTLRFGSASGNTVSVAVRQGFLVGTMRASADGQTCMIMTPASVVGGGNARLYLWNAFNRTLVRAGSSDSAATWTYSSSTAQAANASNSNRISFVTGLALDAVYSEYHLRMVTAAVISAIGSMGIKLDSIGVPDVMIQGVSQEAIAEQFPCSAAKSYQPMLGHHFVQAIDRGDGTNTTTYVGGSIAFMELSLLLPM